MPEQNETRQDDVAVGYPVNVDFLHYQSPTYDQPCDETPKKPFRHRCLLCFLCFLSLFLITSAAIVGVWVRFTSNIPAPAILVESVSSAAHSTRSAHNKTIADLSATFFVGAPDRFSIVGFKKVKFAIINGDSNLFDPVTTGYLMRDGSGGSYLDVKAEGLTMTAVDRGQSTFRLELQATVLIGFGYVFQYEQWHALSATCGNLTVRFPASVLWAVGQFRGTKCIVLFS